ncbi:hypothetical protein JL193_07645 [Polaribacter batillariae]|uniref:GEVED domain-containing protein n=1 Tax=Polaribacter batillariae TaxID=2808900 RepID=A0ABX7T0R7_9FLAO|nr:GEVED domain-containing protein [Polaribacter batillariae]QTD39108.1 hypothetical protein JL193_07645 [Polaribacter batillariae]
MKIPMKKMKIPMKFYTSKFWHTRNYLLFTPIFCMCALFTPHIVEAQAIKVLTSGRSNLANININKPQGSFHQDNKRSVTVLLDEGGLCTATLINTVNQNGKYYLLTVAHCLLEYMVGDLYPAYLTFNYEVLKPSRSIAEDNEPLSYGVLLTIKDILREDDLALLELAPQSLGYPDFIDNLYFSGWSRDKTFLPISVIGHPKGDVKKIFKIPDGAAYQENFLREEPEHDFSYDYLGWYVTHYEDNIEKIEEGASGSGLFNNENQVIGVYSFGDGDDDEDGSELGSDSETHDPDVYSLLANAWDSYDEGDTPFQNSLDPDHTYASTIPGGYGFERGEFQINSDRFNLNIAPSQVLKTPDIGEGGATSQMMKLDLAEFKKLLSKDGPVGGVYLIDGMVSFTIKTYIGDDPNNPQILYSSEADHTGLRTGDFEEKNQMLSQDVFNEILQARNQTIESLEDYKYDLPVVIELKNISPYDEANIRALKIPGSGFRNAVELFKPEEFKALYRNPDYPKNRGLESRQTYIDSLAIEVSMPQGGYTETASFKTENNGGYVNLIQHHFPYLQPGSEVEITFSPRAEEGSTMHYSIWVDYNKDYKFDGLGEHVITDITGTHQEELTTSFLIPDDFSAPVEGIKTRIRIAMRKNAPPPSDGSGTYDIGEVEDYTVVIYPKNNNSALLATAVTSDVSSPAVLVNTKGQCAAVSGDRLQWLSYQDAEGTVNYSACNQVLVDKPSNNQGYTVNFFKKKKYLSIDHLSPNTLSTFNTNTILSKSLRVVSDTVALKLYSFTKTESGQSITYYGFEDLYNKEASLPYRLLPVSGLAPSSGEQSKKIAHSINANALLAGSMSAGSIVAGLTAYGIFQKVNKPRGTVRGIGREENIELEDRQQLIPDREESTGTQGTELRQRVKSTKTNIEESCETEL